MIHRGHRNRRRAGHRRRRRARACAVSIGSSFFLADVHRIRSVHRGLSDDAKWTQVEIGLVLSIGGLVALIGQMPGGAIVDAARSERLVAGLAVATIGASALGYAAWPIFPVVAAAATLHAAASCVLGPAIAAISLGMVGPLAIGERFGRHARYASLGNGVAAAVMGTCGYLLSAVRYFSSASFWRFRLCSHSRESASAASRGLCSGRRARIPDHATSNCVLLSSKIVVGPDVVGGLPPSAKPNPISSARRGCFCRSARKSTFRDQPVWTAKNMRCETSTSRLGPPSYGTNSDGDSISAIRSDRCFAVADPSGERIMVM